jgi:general secretion pathway protein H
MKKKAGFTLIEVLIVMVIISIVAGVAVMTIQVNQRKQYETLANQLVNAITLAEQEAMLRPATLGLAFTSTAWQFYSVKRDTKTNREQWFPLDIPALKSHAFPANTKITLNIQGKIIPAKGAPELVITPGNDLAPFVIYIGKKGEHPYYQVTGKANGEVMSATIQAE